MPEHSLDCSQKKLSGLFLVDASSPEVFKQLESAEIRKKLIEKRHREAPWLYFQVATGLARLAGDYCNPNTSQRIPAVEALARAEDCRPSFMNSWLGEWDDLESSAEQVAELPCCDSIPLVIVSQDPGLRDERGGATWDSVQEQLMRLSSKSIRIIARSSGHFVMVDRPEVVVNGIEIVDDELHGKPARIQPGRTEWR